MLVSGDRIRAHYGDEGLWNWTGQAQGLQIADGAASGWIDVTWPIIPFVVLSVQFDVNGVEQTYLGDMSVPSADWTVLGSADLSAGTMNSAWHEIPMGPLTVNKYEVWADNSQVIYMHFTVTNDGPDTVTDFLLMHGLDPDQDVSLAGGNACDAFGCAVETFNDAVDLTGNGVYDWVESDAYFSGWTTGYGVCQEGQQLAGHTDWEVDADAPFFDYNTILDDVTQHIRHPVVSIGAGQTVDFGFVFVWDTDYLGAQALYLAESPLLCASSDVDGDGFKGPLFGGGDCDDDDDTVFPGAPEILNDGIDQDCDGSDAAGAGCFENLDGDAFGSSVTITSADMDCTDLGEASVSGDCNDNDPGVFPGAAELAGDGIDQDCDGTDSVNCFEDQDADGFGSTTQLLSGDADCLDAGESTVSTDCNDGNANVNPGMAEVIGDGIDQDCTGFDSIECFQDNDGDAFGSTVVVISVDSDCADTGEAGSNTDCDDASASVYPGAPEIAGDGIDQDCNGSDQSVTQPTECLEDLDGDGYGNGNVVQSADADCNDLGEASLPNDCDDTNDQVYPGAFEICDGLDSDCDGSFLDDFSDLDGDELPDCIDEDIDGDGILNTTEGTGDPDGDGIPNQEDTDSDGDGIPDSVEGTANNDGDDIPNYLDLDSDDDGIPDSVEGNVDTDGDGVPNYLDLDSDDDTLTDIQEGTGDVDGDGVPNYLDLNADGDSADDYTEGDGDVDGDGIPNWLDPDDGGGVNPGDDDDATGDDDDSVDPGDDDDDAELTWYPTGGVTGCNQGSEGPSGLLVLALFAVLALRRRGWSTLALVVTLGVGLSAPAAAQMQPTLDVQRFLPVGSPRGFVTVQTGNNLPQLGFKFDAFFQYGHRPFQKSAVDQGGLVRDVGVMDGLFAVHLGAGFGITDWAEIAVRMPVVQIARLGEGFSQFSAGDKTVGLGDLAIEGRFRILDERKVLGLALSPFVTLPIGSKELFLSDGVPTFGARLAVSKWWTPVHIGAHVGYRLKPNSADIGQRWAVDDEVLYAAGVGFSPVPDVLDINFELSGAVVVGPGRGNVVAGALSGATYAPMELIADVRIHTPVGVSITLGAGPGLTPAVGTPQFRALASVGYAPMGPAKEKVAAVREPVDSDGDGIVDEEDLCPNDPEDMDGWKDEDGCADSDNDQDAIPDTEDSCPDVPEDVDNIEDEDGCPDLDDDEDGVLDVDDACPLAPEDIDDFNDEDGCPDPDNDEDGVLDGDDLCPNQPEDGLGDNPDDGCPGETLVVVKGDRILILQKVEFYTNKDVIIPRSYPLLDAVFETLRDNPQLLRVRVEGHTDSRGSDTYNQQLSDKRAKAIMKFLVDREIAPERLEAKGYGEERPIDSNETEQGMQANRRVEFVILEQE